MTNKLVLIQGKGQLTIPATLRKQLGLTDGSPVEIKVEEDTIKITPMDVKARVKRVNKALNEIGSELRRRGYSLAETLKNLKKIKRERFLIDYPKLSNRFTQKT